MLMLKHGLYKLIYKELFNKLICLTQRTHQGKMPVSRTTQEQLSKDAKSAK